MPPIPSDREPDIAAAELALDLLEGEERAAALRRMLAEPGFADDVGRWRRRFALWFELWPDAEPPADGFARIERRLFAPSKTRDGRVWRGLAILSGLVAACLLLFVAVRDTTPSPAPALIASIVPAQAGTPIAALYDPATGRLSLNTASPSPADKSAQLWIIGADGVPHALGLMARSGAVRIALTPDNRARMRAGSVVAISLEPLGGSPGPLPTGPVVATGALTPA